MAWELLPTNYTNAVWSGLRRFVQVNNEDGTVSFQDVTVYTQKENSFFGARDANRMNEALNTIMSMVNNGTDLYGEFQRYFATQKDLFESKATATQDGFTVYVGKLEDEGDKIIANLKTGYVSDITQFKNAQEAAFNAWFGAMQGALSQDVAGNLQNQCTELDERLSRLEYMTIQNDFTAPLATDDEAITLIVDDNGNSILAEWTHREG